MSILSQITDINDNLPTINLAYRTPSGRPEIREDAAVGVTIADVTVKDPDQTRRPTGRVANSNMY